MPTAQFWATILAGGLAGAVLSQAWTWYRETRAQQRARAGHWAFLRTEIQFCGAVAHGYAQGGILVPAYRMPLQAYRESLPKLLAEGLVGEDDAQLLLRYFVNAGSFNRGLDLAQAAVDRGVPERAIEEANRVRLKASKLRPGMPGAETHYDRALGVVNAHARAHGGALSIPDLAKDLRDDA